MSVVRISYVKSDRKDIGGEKEVRRLFNFFSLLLKILSSEESFFRLPPPQLVMTFRKCLEGKEKSYGRALIAPSKGLVNKKQFSNYLRATVSEFLSIYIYSTKWYIIFSLFHWGIIRCMETVEWQVYSFVKRYQSI